MEKAQYSITILDDGIFEISVGYDIEEKNVDVVWVELQIKGVGMIVTDKIEGLVLPLRNKVMDAINQRTQDLINL